MARDSGAPTAFYHFSAPDAMTLAPTGELNIGPTTIQTRLREGPAGTAAWRWWPVITIAARSGDLGATIGESEIQLSTSNIFYSKYITVWRRQRDQSLKFVIDAGSARPRTR
jgi:hypothetical protein